MEGACPDAPDCSPETQTQRRKTHADPCHPHIALGLTLASTFVSAQERPPYGVRTLSPAGAIKPTGTWNLATRAGDFVFIAGMRGIDPATNRLFVGDEARVRQAFLNMKHIAASEGASLRDAVRPIINKVQSELWSDGPFPPRTIVEIHRLNQDDIAGVEGTFYRFCDRASPTFNFAQTIDVMRHARAWSECSFRGALLYVTSSLTSRQGAC